MAMLTDKELKKKFKPIFSQDPKDYYPVEFIKSQNFHRNQCEHCKKYFWSTQEDRKVCGDAECLGGVSLFDAKSKGELNVNKLSYVEVWQKYSEFFKSRGYNPINRYPVVARWNATVDFTIASIAAFQPYVVAGEVEPPFPKLVIPQFCLRFGDVDNVGVTGSHCTGFVMIGQHAFLPKEEWNQEQLFTDIYEYLIKVVGLPKDKLVLHEDAWAGGGNFGPCIEFFSHGIELFNQVYMMFEHHEKEDVPLQTKVLDMGLGMERIAWFTQATPTLYDAIFPQTLSRVLEKIDVNFDTELFMKFAPHASLLNLDEVEDVNVVWKEIADKLNLSVEELKKTLEPMIAIYSIIEHTRSLSIAITDGGLPSNTGGGYNLRVILKRALMFITKFKWNLNLSEIAKWHAEELKDLFPELNENISEISEILEYETQRYHESLKRNKQEINNLAKKNKTIDLDMLLELYDSKGISPEEIAQVIDIEIPDNFYSLVSEKHEQQVAKTQTRVESDLDLVNLDETNIMYFDDYNFTEFEATIIKIKDNKIILDKTAFYPTSGGQLHDIGTMNNDVKVTKVIKQGKHIVHIVDDASKLKEHELVKCKIDSNRRLQLAQHHSATHIINGAARITLGNHVWQAGASKTLEKARLDITHYKQISPEQLEEIERLSNQIIQDNITINKSLLPRQVAESRFGFRLYQGGAVPGKVLRIVEIPGIDVEACGGTHLNSTSEASKIKIFKTSKLQDGIVRIEFTAGLAATKLENANEDITEKVKTLLNCEENQIVSRVNELFSKWKKVKKLRKKKQDIPQEMLILSSTEEVSTDSIGEAAKALKTQKEHVVKTIERFLKELKN
jgi:alanyl-tRNA synthetase